MAGRARVETWWTAIGAYRHTVHLSEPGPTVPDGDGGFTQGDQPLTPATMPATIAPLTAGDLEQQGSGTTTAIASHVIAMPYHPGVTTKTTVTFNGRTFNVTGIRNLEERNRELRLTCAEVIP